jgi:triacylglycerol lipase
MRPFQSPTLHTPLGGALLFVVVVAAAAAGAVGAQVARRPVAPAPVTLERTPVLLVPGWGDDAGQLAPLWARFVAAGWPDSAVVALSFHDPVGSNRDNARVVARAVTELRIATSSDRVDVVAHSMGGLAVRHYLLQAGGVEVRRVVFLATPHRGTYSAFVAWGEGGREMSPGSEFLNELNSRLYPLPSGVEGLTVRTPVDLHILPPESATLHPLPDVEVCCPTHAGLLDHAETFRVVESFLKRTP